MGVHILGYVGMVVGLKVGRIWSDPSVGEIDLPVTAGAAIGSLFGVVTCGAGALVQYRIRPTRKQLLHGCLLLAELAVLMVVSYLGYLAGQHLGGPVAGLIAQWFCNLFGGVALIVFHALVTGRRKPRSRRKRARTSDGCSAEAPTTQAAPGPMVAESCHC